MEYLGGVARFELTSDGRSGTDLRLTHTGQTGEQWIETHAGWLSVLFPLKAAVAHGVDYGRSTRSGTGKRGSWTADAPRSRRVRAPAR